LGKINFYNKKAEKDYDILAFGNSVLIDCKILSIGGIHLGINYSVLTRQNEMNSDRIPKILGWKTIRLIPEIFVQ
jgi:hypothetical protein